MKVKIETILTAPWNTRTEITEKSVRTLAESIKADGLFQSLNVIANPDPNGPGFICYDGNRRLAAVKSLGWDEVEVNVSYISVQDAKIRTITANMEREEDEPLRAAQVISDLLEDGFDAGEIAARLVKSVSWVNRRRKLLTLTDEVKDVANKITVECLERIAAIPENVQKRVIKAIRDRSKWQESFVWTDIAPIVNRESADIDEAKFEKSECAKCLKRTGIEGDLFGICDGKLGRCLDCKCFNAKVAEHIKELVAKAIPASVEERVEEKYSWSFPEEADGKKPTKAKPCAYYWIDANGDEVVVKYGPSKQALDEAKREKERKREEERAAKAKEREFDDAVEDKLSEACNDEELIAGHLASNTFKDCDDAERDLFIEIITDWLNGWHNSDENAHILHAFDWMAKLAGIDEADRAKYIERNMKVENEEEAE